MQIGDRLDDNAITVPKEMYSKGGVLEKMPVTGTHSPGVRTKVLRRLASRLIEVLTDVPADSPNAGKEYADKESNKGSMSIYINDLVEVMRKELMYASRSGKNYVFTQRAERMLRKASAIAIKASLRDMLDAWVDRMGDEIMKGEKESTECLSTPAVSTARTIMGTDLNRRLIFPEEGAMVHQQQLGQIITPPVDLTDETEEDESDINIVLSQLREETILQNLLHKRLSSNKERVLTLEHRNGRMFRVVLPPDSRSSNSFVDDAKKSRWINQMLYSDQKKRGMLLYLAQTQPDIYVHVANQKKITLQSAVLKTPQTLALGRLTGINDTQMSKLRSFLKHVGKAELKLSKKEVICIDTDVGLYSNLPQPTFGTYNLEWSMTSGANVEKKLPEACSYWNGELLVEVAAEADLVLQSMFLKKPNMTTVPTLDYRAPGFDDTAPGIVVLFGGDHGAGACPCSLKINFSSPQERKQRNELNF